jgi:hypothetical protein
MHGLQLKTRARGVGDFTLPYGSRLQRLVPSPSHRPFRLANVKDPVLWVSAQLQLWVMSAEKALC